LAWVLPTKRRSFHLPPGTSPLLLARPTIPLLLMVMPNHTLLWLSWL